MQSTARKKIIYTDSERDIAITGIIVKEDDFFFEIINDRGRLYKIGKKSIVCIKEAEKEELPR